MASSTLKEAYRLIKAGAHDEAKAMLKPYLQEHPKDPNGWWLMSYAVTNVDKRRQMLERVVELDPDFGPAQDALDRLDSAAADDYYPSSKSPASASSSAKKSAKQGGSNALVIVGVVLIVTAVIVLGCGMAFRAGVGGLEDLANQIAANVTVEHSSGGGGGSGGSAGNAFSGHGWDVINKGGISPGQTVNGNVDTFDDDGWVLTVSSRQQVTIEVNATGDLDTELYLYDSSGRLIEENDDIDFMDNTDSRIKRTLDPGTYGVVVSAFGGGGGYRLSVR
jgi:hypothetical protein